MATVIKRSAIRTLPVVVASTPVPTFVQAVASDLNDNNGITGNNYVFNLPNASLSNNAIILAVAYPFGAGRTLAISDSTTATWASPVITAGTASAGHMNLSIYVLPSVAAALHTLTFTLDAEVKPFWYEMVEFYNVSTADGSHGQVVAGPSISAGSYTPSTNNDANGGHLIFTCAISDDTVGTGSTTQASAMSATGGASLIHANNICTIPQISSYIVQATNGAINPGFSVTQSSGTNFVCASIALKAANAGTAPAAGIRIAKLIHYSVVNPALGNNVILFPCTGNLRVATMAAGDNLNKVNSVTDSAGKTYNVRALAGESQIFDIDSVTGSDALTLTFNLSAPDPQFSVHFYDIVGAAASAFDTKQGFNGTSPASSPFNDFPDITPTSAPGLTIVQLGLGTSAQGSIASGAPAGAVFDCISYTTSAPLFDQDRMDNADPFGHANYSTTAAQTWNWNMGAAAFSQTLFGTAITYKSA